MFGKAEGKEEKEEGEDDEEVEESEAEESDNGDYDQVLLIFQLNGELKPCVILRLKLLLFINVL